MNDLFLDELDHILMLCFLQGYYLYPFGEVVVKTITCDDECVMCAKFLTLLPRTK